MTFEFQISVGDDIYIFIYYVSDSFLFLHFGTSSEVLDHLGAVDSALIGRRHLCSIPANTVSDIAASAIILSSKIAPCVSIGEDSLIYDSRICHGVQIGSQSIVVGVNVPDVDRTADEPYRFVLPDRHCLWEVPLVGCTDRVIVFCGLHDNPKISIAKGGTFCGKPWEKVICDLGIQESDLWTSNDDQGKCLWSAKLFPILPYSEMLSMAMWLMGLSGGMTEHFLSLWKSSPHVSLENCIGPLTFPKCVSGLVIIKQILLQESLKLALVMAFLGAIYVNCVVRFFRMNYQEGIYARTSWSFIQNLWSRTPSLSLKVGCIRCK